MVKFRRAGAGEGGAASRPNFPIVHKPLATSFMLDSVPYIMNDSPQLESL